MVILVNNIVKRKMIYDIRLNKLRNFYLMVNN